MTGPKIGRTLTLYKRRNIVALAASVLTLAAWGGGTSAHSRPEVALHLSAHQLTHPGRVIVRARTIGLLGSKRYAFRVKGATGGWRTVRRLNPTLVAGISLDRVGTYSIDAVVQSHCRQPHGVRTQVIVSAPEVIYVGAKVSVSLNASSVGVGHAVSMTAQAKGIAGPLYRFVMRQGTAPWKPLTAFSPRRVLNTPAEQPGPYQLAVQAKARGGPVLESSPASLSVYGPAARIILTPSQKVWVADGKEMETLTASIVDAQGDLVSNFNGTGSLVDNSPAGAIAKWGETASALTSQASAKADLVLNFVNGKATVVLQSGRRVAQDALVATSSLNSSQTLTGTTTIAAVAQKPSHIALNTSSPYLIANESGNPANYTVALTDQASEPMLTGTYHLTATLIGPGQFHNLSAGPYPITYTGGQGAAPVTVYSMAGSLGPLTLNVQYPGLSKASLTLNAILGGQPYQMGVSAPQTTLKDGQSTTLTLTQLTKTGGVSDPASLDNSGYVVSITNPNGSEASGFALNGSSYAAPTTIAVATGPNFFYAVSQPVALTVTNAAPGTYLVTVADADGQWKTSQPLTIQVRG